MGEKKPRVSYKTLYTESNGQVNDLTDKAHELGLRVSELELDVLFWRTKYEKAYAERGVWAKMKEFFSL